MDTNPTNRFLNETNKRKLQQVTLERGQGKRKKDKVECKFEGCGFSASTTDQLDEHRAECHCCKRCKCSVNNLLTHTKCSKKEIVIPQVEIDSAVFQKRAQANRGALVSYITKYTDPKPILLPDAVNKVYKDLHGIINNSLNVHRGLRVQFTFQLDVTEIKTGEKAKRHIVTNYKRVLSVDTIDSEVLYQIDFANKLLQLQMHGTSGIVVDGVDSLEVNIGVYRPVRPRSFIELPVGLKGRHGLLSIKTKDSGCFRLSVIAALFGHRINLGKYQGLDSLTPQQRQNVKRRMEHPHAYTLLYHQLKQENLINFTDFEDEFDINDIHLFEEREKISINVYEYDETVSDVHPLRITNFNFGIEQHVNLLLLTHEEEDGSIRHHFVLIQNPSRFFGKTGDRVGHICPWCAQRFTTTNHLAKCQAVHSTGFKLPTEENNRFQFRDYYKCIPPPYRIYTEPLFYNDGDLKMAGYGVVAIGPNQEILESQFYIGVDAIDSYMDYIFPLATKLSNKIGDEVLPIPKMTDEELKMFNAANHCSKCHKPFTTKAPKSRHHSHHINNFPIEPVCGNCNLQISIRKQVPLFSHSHAKVGSKLMIANLSSKNTKSVKVYPITRENFLAIIFDNKLKLLDSRRFLDYDIVQLQQYLHATSEDNSLCRPKFEQEYIQQPVFLPHTWFTDLSKLSVTSLPQFEQFNDVMRDQEMSTEDYNDALDIFHRFGCASFRDYCMVYLKSRLYTVAAAMAQELQPQEFGDWCFKTYQLSPFFDFSLASYAYNCVTFHAKSNFEIPSDPKLVQTILANIRGGVSHLSKRIVTAKSELLGHKNVKNEERKHLLVTDINSLYQYCLMQPMPFEDYRWLSEQELESVDILSHDGSDGIGRIYGFMLWI